MAFFDQQLPAYDGLGLPIGQTDTSTLAAHDFDVDVRTGFMPPNPPLASLPPAYFLWESLLRDALTGNFPINPQPPLWSQSARTWHHRLVSGPLLSTQDLTSEPTLRRAHLVLASILHIFVHSQPCTTSVLIPQAIAIPLLRVSRILHIPPLLTYSDTVLYNWELKDPSQPVSESNIRMSTLLSSTPDEAHFYLTSALIELRGVRALDLMRSSMNEAFIGDETAVRRITTYLIDLAKIIEQLSDILRGVKTACSPTTFYNQIRPWLRGAELDEHSRPTWIFENAEHFGFAQPIELSGPSAGQSSLIHALDIFLGIHKYTHTALVNGQQQPFLERMKLYTPRHHRAFLNHLASEPQLRAFVDAARSPPLNSAFLEVVRQMKIFRDQHIKIVALYIISPSRAFPGRDAADLKGTGGSDVMPFLKQVRDQTTKSISTT